MKIIGPQYRIINKISVNKMAGPQRLYILGYLNALLLSSSPVPAVQAVKAVKQLKQSSVFYPGLFESTEALWTSLYRLMPSEKCLVMSH